MPTNPDVGTLYALQVSRNKHDSSTGAGGETPVYRFHANPDSVTLAPLERDFYHDDNESGKESHLSEAQGVPIRSRWAKSMTFPLDETVAMHMLYYCLNGDATSSVNQLASTGKYEHSFRGPADLVSVRAFDAEDLGRPAASDSTQNFVVQNIVPTRVEITAGGLEATCSVDLICGGEVAGLAGSATALTHARKKILFPNHMYLFTSDTTGFLQGTFELSSDAGGASDVEDVFEEAPTSALAQAKTELSGSLTDYTSLVESVTLRGLNNIDLDASYAPGTVDADGAMVVADDAWFRTAEGQQMEIDLTLKLDDTTNALRSEVEDGTRRPWELWFWNPSAVTSGVYSGLRITMGIGKPMSYVEGSNGLGHKTVTLTYRAQRDTTANYGWNILGHIQDSSGLGS